MAQILINNNITCKYFFYILENSELGKRFKIERDDFPAVVVFVKNNLKGKLILFNTNSRQNIILLWGQSQLSTLHFSFEKKNRRKKIMGVFFPGAISLLRVKVKDN